MTLNGWRRLWVVVSALWLSCVLVLCYQFWPTAPPPQQTAAYPATDTTVPMVSPDGKDVADVRIDQIAHYKSLGAKVVLPPDSTATLAAIRAELRQRQRSFAGEIIALATLPIGLLYLVGSAIAWVRRGFVNQHA